MKPNPERIDISGACNSTIGRFFVVLVLTLGLFLGACAGVVYLRMPANSDGGFVSILGILTTLDICILFTIPAYLAESSGMSSRNVLKQYFCMWRLSLFLMPFAFVFLLTGYGEMVKFGEFQRQEGSIGFLGHVTDIQKTQVGYPFASIDGYVATNLTRAFVKGLLVPDNPLWTGMRVVREAPEGASMNDTIIQKTMFSEWRYFEPENPAVQGYKKPHPEDTMAYYIVAPIFTKREKCLTHTRATTTCMNKHPIIALAVQERTSICNSLKMVKCIKHELEILPMDGCIDGAHLCGRVVSRPTKILLEDIVNGFSLDGWKYSINNGTADHIHTGEEVLAGGAENSPVSWVNVNHDVGIMDTETWMATWKLRGVIGVLFAVFITILLLLTVACDCYADYKLRVVRPYVI